MRYEEIAHKRYVYRLTHSYCHELGFTVQEIKGNDWCGMFPRRALIIESGYCWDGMTCFPDLKGTQRASLVHDSLCQLERLGHVTRKQADREFKRVLIADGMNRVLAEAIYRAVRLYALITRQ